VGCAEWVPPNVHDEMVRGVGAKEFVPSGAV